MVLLRRLLDSREVELGEVRLRWLQDVATQHEALPLMLRVHKEVIVQGPEVQFALLARRRVHGVPSDFFHL